MDQQMDQQMQHHMNQLYEERVNYICNIPRFTRKAKLDNTRLLLEELGNPQLNYKSIHVAGTNGKGSVSKMMAGVLEKSGYKTGLFISPHLVRINERISVNHIDISDEDFLEADKKVMAAVTKLLDENEAFEHPAFFEYVFALGALYFFEQGCDFVVFETGLGGRFDATNVLIPEICIITSIGLDHMQYLGNTIKEIAGEKAGIIKTGIPVVYNTGDKEADEVIESVSEKVDTVCYTVECLKEKGFTEDIEDSVFDAVAGYEKENAKTALLASRILLKEKFDPDKYSSVIKEFSFPGRLEYIKRNIILDGAHNEDAVKALIISVNEICKRDGFKNVSLFFAVSSDKDYNSIIKLLVDGLDIEDVYVSELSSSRKEDAGTVMELFQKYLPAQKHFDVVESKNMKRLWEIATGELESDTLLLVVGSLYMVGEIKGFL